jgi:adenine-specific DNA-methyltransferase
VKSDEVSRKSKQSTPAHGSVRAAARGILANGPISSTERLRICRSILEGRNEALLLWNSDEAAVLTDADRAYRVSALYILLMPPARRQTLAAYFTPPHLCEHVLDRLEAHGWRPDCESILDPACGGAAFLVPAAYRMRDTLLAQGVDGPAALNHARLNLFGVEIECGLRTLSEMLIAAAFKDALCAAGESTLEIIARGNALKLLQTKERFDAVVSNPPYGRVFRASPALRSRWASVISDGHINTYALFIALSLEQVVEGGLIAVIVPTSFLSGPYFRKLRGHILDRAAVLELNVVEKRSDVFMDVVQDTCVLICRRKASGRLDPGQPTASVVSSDGTTHMLGSLDVPVAGERPWALPSQLGAGPVTLFDQDSASLASYGYRAKSGYFVWNRSRHLLFDRASPNGGELPLIWAQNIRPGQIVLPRSKPNSTAAGVQHISFVQIPPTSSAILRGPALVLQRTTNRSQKRRLICGMVPQVVTDEYGGFVTENHTIVVSPDPEKAQLVSLELLLSILNSAAVDRVYRRISGTVSISTRVLQTFVLPPAK